METPIIVLAMDYETEFSTPVNPRVIRPIEIGAVLYDCKNNFVLETYNEMIFERDHAVSPKELVELTGLTDEMREKHGVPSIEAHQRFNSMAAKCDFIMGHNAREFDKIVYEEECDRLGLPVSEKPWIDTKTDLPYPKKMKSRKLIHTYAEHEYKDAHRALVDVNFMLKILGHYDIEEVIGLSKQENVRVIASVSYQNKDLAKERGYYWDGENKRWTKQMKEQQALKEQNEAPFPVQVLMS